MSKEENIIEITEKIKLSTFKPKKEETIFITSKSWEYTPEEAKRILEVVSFMFPDNQVMFKFDNITIESMFEDDLK